MLPLQQAYEVKHSILEYLKATFSFKDKAVHSAFYNFINDEENGIFKGPYVSLKLPFITATEEQEIPLEIKPSFPPYHHQYISFQRLSTQGGHQPQSTLITTGTSSGKTESFLYPVLDFCYKNHHRPGIKVIILYPMNALATDQAKRLAEAIWKDDRLKGKITAGLFIGEGKDKKDFPKDMGEEHIIENRNSIVDSPPDILLTNFKMLDYALMRNNYHNLWVHNLADPSLLQFLILDELHTYDGAQGTDVANLIRRLKLKLSISKGQVCAVGTSATIGSGEESKQLLAEYAQKVFGEDFSDGAIITENRMSVNDFFDADENLKLFIPEYSELQKSSLSDHETYEQYISRQKSLWQLQESTDAVSLGIGLKRYKVIKDLVGLASKRIILINDLIRLLSDVNEEFKQLPEWDEVNEINPRMEVLASLLALISEARIGKGKLFPFLYLQIQIWVRELSGVLREMNSKPVFTWKDKVEHKNEKKALPAYYCPECGSSGWLGIKDDNKNHFFSDPKQVYEYFFSNHKNVYFINTSNHKYIDEYEPSDLINSNINTLDLNLQDKEDDQSVKVQAVRKVKDNKSKHICPECNTEGSVRIIGTRIATLSSITVSQVLSSDLDPRTEKYRKILAFTNSVQDAAHQAGFVEARNYRFTFRASLQKVINKQERPMTIPQLQDAFIDYWKQNSDELGKNTEDAYFYRFFPADYAGKVDIHTDYRRGNKFTDVFKREFDERMKWEVSAEFGYNAAIGRTLEKTGASGIKFNEEKLKLVFPAIQTWLEANALGSLSEHEFIPFVNGLLHRTRIRGGIDHEFLSKFRENKNELWELNWMRDNRHFLNKMFHPKARFPKIITTQPHSRGILDTTYTSTNNWYRSYYLKSFPLAPAYPALVNEFYRRLLEALMEVGLMNKKGSDGNENYAIAPGSIIVESKVRHHRCDICEGILSVAASDCITFDTRCLDYNCSGIYKEVQRNKPNYYQLVYNRNRSPRIYASEHTGLLERKDRERKEISFKERPDFNSLNAIVATSTLEMGIDIGTLNTVINNSVPPLTSNFLQRVGRAGRSSGSALITNFAASEAHDLFYYEEPTDMMEGEIATPGCYLEAREILYRHFFAYCLDNWTSEDPQKHSIPGRIISLRLSSTDLSSADFLANRIIGFIKANETKLLNQFINFYKVDLEDAKVLDSLRSFLLEETFYLRIQNVFVKLKNEYLSINEKRKEIDKIIKEKKLPESDEERKVLEEEKKALWGLKRLIDKRSVLEHLTNVGMLPNYAFPETGVTLNARVRANKAKGSENIPSDKQFEIVRSSAVAIRELAPENYFYSQGYKFNISGINTFDWKDPGILLTKRFCSNCDHLADSAKSDETHCPKCGDASWSSVKNKHVFVKLSGVKSINTRDKSTLDDSSDDRDSSYYRISRHISFDYNSFQGAWGMKDIPFGIEYVKNVDITEVNLGLSSSVDANKININQIADVPFHGFVTCRYCGKSTSTPHLNRDDSSKFHYGYCKHKDKEYQGKTDEVFEEIYLFREIKTEALKVLLPVQEFDSEATVNMFKAGLELGLKKYYKGNPQHLGIVDYAEYNSKTSRFDRYLVIYDHIPGGTGYLERLFHPVEFTSVIEKAYQAIKECGCQFKNKDGCYRCIFTYGNQYVQEELSRSKAEIFFKKLVERSNAWETYSSGLGSLSGTGQIEESELEERFIRSLRNYIDKKEKAGERCRFEEFVDNGVINYKIKLTNNGYSFSYVIRPQYDLGPAQGVRYNTRADFFISLTAIEKDGAPVEDENLLSSAKCIAVYLDGYTYHATKENCRFFNDVRKRLAIVAAGDKITWSLTWQDIEKQDALEKEGDPKSMENKTDSLAIDAVKFRDTINTYKRFPYWSGSQSGLLQCRNSFERLLWLLLNPLDEGKKEKRTGLMLSLRQVQFAVPSADEEVIDQILYAEKIDNTTRATKTRDGNFYVFPELPALGSFASIRAGVKVSDLSVKSLLVVNESQDTLDKQAWENFWPVFNLVQSFCTLADAKPSAGGSVTDTTDTAPTTEDKYGCLQYFDLELHSIVRALIDHDIPFNQEGGFFLEQGGSFAEAMLGFHDKKLFIHPLSQTDKQTFEQAGYQELKPEDFKIENYL